MRLVVPTKNETEAARSAQMARIRARDTKPEMRVRRALHGAGLRYRLHAKGLPGKPDLVFSRQSCRLVRSRMLLASTSRSRMQARAHAEIEAGVLAAEA